MDYLINNAASGVQKLASELETKHWDWTLNINAKAPWLCSVEASKLMKDGGSIVNISSIGAVLGFPDNPSYCSSKGALEALTRSLSIDYSIRNIRVNIVRPGYNIYTTYNTYGIYYIRYGLIEGNDIKIEFLAQSKKSVSVNSVI